MRKTSKKKAISAENIARLADKGEDVSGYFTKRGRMMPPLNVGLDLNQDLLDQLTKTARNLNVSRQTLIKRFIRRGLQQHYLDQKTRKAG